MKKKCRLSIIVVSWNTRELLARCLGSIESERGDLGPGELELIVVDNASDDGSPEMVENQFPWVQVVRNSQNRGFAGANNQGIRQSNGRYILLLNSDTEVYPGAFRELVQFMDDHPQAGGCGARLLNPDGSLQPACHPMLTPGREFWRLTFLDRIIPWATYPMAQWDITTPRRVDVIKGACLLLRRSALEQVGLLDERYFMYTEEMDLCYRLSQEGWQLWYIPAAVITHHGGASSRLVAEEMYLELYRSKVQFHRKIGGKKQTVSFKSLVVLAYLPRILLQPKNRVYRRLLAKLPGM